MCKISKLVHIKKLSQIKENVDDRKIGSFISSIIMLLVSVALICIIFYMNFEFASAVENSATGGLVLILFLPLGITITLLTGSTMISALIASFTACFSSNKTIKIVSIILFILSLAAAGAYIYSIIKYASLLGG